MSATERIERIFRDALAIDLPATTTDLLDSGLLDSLALVTLLFEVEQEFAISLSFEDLDLDSIRSVERIVALVERPRGADVVPIVDRICSPARAIGATTWGS